MVPLYFHVLWFLWICISQIRCSRIFICKMILLFLMVPSMEVQDFPIIARLLNKIIGYKSICPVMPARLTHMFHCIEHVLTLRVHNNFRNRHLHAISSSNNQESTPYWLCAIQCIYEFCRSRVMAAHLQIWYNWGCVWGFRECVWMSHRQAHNKVHKSIRCKKI